MKRLLLTIKYIALKTSNKNLKDIETLSEWLDTKFTIPVINYKIGLDPIIGLFPVLGDLLTYGVSSFLVYKMAKEGASTKLLIKMAGNILLDLIIGAIPVVGWIFDFTFRANEKNVKLLKEHYLEDKHQGSGLFILLMCFLFFGLLAFVLMFFVTKLFIWSISYFKTFW